MKTRIAVLLMVLAGSAAAESANGYLFFAPSKTNGDSFADVLHGGGGLDAVIAKGLGANLELGGLWPRGCFGNCVLGVFSAGPVFYPRYSAESRLDPFISGGYTLLFRSGHANAYYIGGGANYWFSSHVGVRLEARFHDLTQRYGGHFWGLRVGLALH